jgi:hypothetical protein
MKSINGLSFEYRGKAGGVDAEKHDDVLTFKTGASKGQILFERAGNKSIWQNIRNAFNQKYVARFDDVVNFLKSRGMETDAAKSAARNIRQSDGTFMARHFEALLSGELKNYAAPNLTENEKELFNYKAENKPNTD